jgi:putative Mn2+ efflux pump MntP
MPAGFSSNPRLAPHTPPSVRSQLIELWGIEMKASILSFRAAVLLGIAGIWGILMGVSQDHSTMPAHAHLNLLGWVSLFLFGIYYHLHPTVHRSRLASVQVWVWIAGTIILTIGVGLVHSGHEIGDPIAAVSSLVVLAETLLFGWLVFRREPAGLVSPESPVPAE